MEQAKKKVLLFINNLDIGGAETVVKNYAYYLDKTKYDVAVLCYWRAPNSPYEQFLIENGVKIFFVYEDKEYPVSTNPFSRIINHYHRYLGAKKYIHEYKPDIIHAHSLLARDLQFAKPDKNTAIFYTQHFNVAWLESGYDKEISAIKWLLAHYKTTIIALDMDMQAQLRQIFNTDRVRVINNGIDVVRYRGMSTEEKKEKRTELGLPADAFVVVHVGRFDPVKNHSFLVDVFEQIKKKKPKAYLLMVGKGETEADTIAKLEAAGLQDSYKIIHDRLDVPEILQVCDAGLFPSIAEGLPISLIEKQAAGIPTVASAGVPEKARVSDVLRFLDLNKSSKEWADTLLVMVSADAQPADVNLNQWDARECVKALEKLYDGKDVSD